MTMTSGSRLGPYEITAHVGEGGMGDVYQAVDTRLGRTVAIKVSKEQYSARFEREARAVAALNHPHVCQLYDVGPNYLVMEFVAGVPVGPSDDPGRIIQLALQTADALVAAHAAGIVHRDLKPDNILVTATGDIKILDFGVATTVNALDSDSFVTMGATVAGTTVGTVAYMSPEQARGEPVDARSDLWSFGVVLYELVTGVRPFDGPTPAVIFAAVLGQQPVPVDTRNPRVPEGLARVIERLLEKDREVRYQSAADVRADLKRLERDSAAVPAHTPASTAMNAAVSAPQPTSSRRGPWLAAAGAMVALTLAGWAVFFRAPARSAALTDRDLLVLAELTNNTGDRAFDGTLRDAVAASIEESPFLKVVGDEQIRQDLRLLGRSPEDRVTDAVAREICLREGQKATLGGSIASLGSRYAITLEATNCQTGESLAREQAQAAGKDQVLEAIGTVTRALRQRLGESLETIRAPQARANLLVTTTSLAAFQAYAQGLDQFYRGDFFAAVSFFERATMLDPKFASAWRLLAIAAGNAQMGAGRSQQALTKAFALIDRVSERERLAIAATYYDNIERDTMKARAAYEEWARAFPRVAEPRNALAGMHAALGQLERMIELQEETYRLEPFVAVSSNNLIGRYVRLNRFDDARRVAMEMRSRGLDPPGNRLLLLIIALREGNAAALDEQVRWFTGRDNEWQAYNARAQDATLRGQRRRGSEFARRGSEIARQRGLEGPAENLADGARDMLREYNDCPATERIGAVAAMDCNDVREALAGTEQVALRFPKELRVTAVQLPILRARLALQEDDAERMLEALKVAEPHDRAQPRITYLRGLALLRLGRGAEAAAAFQTMIDRQVWDFTYPMAWLGLGRSAAMTGDTARAKQAYESFFTFWKDADADVPVLQRARAEYAALR